MPSRHGIGGSFANRVPSDPPPHRRRHLPLGRPQRGDIAPAGVDLASLQSVQPIHLVEVMMPLAMRLTRRSTHRRHALAAVVVRGGAVVAAAANGSRKGQCAERRAIRRARYEGASLYVARSNGLCSKPCPDCQEAIKLAGIKKVYFVGSNGMMEEWRVG